MRFSLSNIVLLLLATCISLAWLVDHQKLSHNNDKLTQKITVNSSLVREYTQESHRLQNYESKWFKLRQDRVVLPAELDDTLDFYRKFTKCKYEVLQLQSRLKCQSCPLKNRMDPEIARRFSETLNHVIVDHLRLLQVNETEQLYSKTQILQISEQLAYFEHRAYELNN